MLKECKTKECQKKLQQLKWKEQGSEDNHTKDGETSLKVTNTMGIKNRQAMVSDHQEQRKTALEAKLNKRLQCLRR